MTAGGGRHVGEQPLRSHIAALFDALDGQMAGEDAEQRNQRRGDQSTPPPTYWKSMALAPFSRRHAPGLAPVARRKTREKWL